MTNLSVADQAILRARLRRRTAARLTGYADDPVGFIERECGDTLWSKQRQIAEAVRDYRHVAVPSCHDSGKSFIAARIAAWWLASRPIGEAFVVTTAPTLTQVRAILWREIARAHRAGRLPGRLNQTEWYMPAGEKEELVAYGRKPSDWDEDAFQGIHARYVLAILDEAGGVPRSLYTAVETITTSEECRVLAIGNPDHPGTQFARVCSSPDWEVIPIDGLETPNFTDEPVPDALRGLLLSRVWVEERRRDWGEDDPQFIAKVRGQFPPRPAGAVYSVDPGIHQWVGELPPFKRFVGGIDIGGQNIHDHATAAILGGVTAPGARCGPDRLVRLACFKDRGPGVYERLLRWMAVWEPSLKRRIIWRGDKTQMLGLELLKRMGTQIRPSHGGPGSVNAGIGLVQQRLKIDAHGNPGSYYTAECQPWLEEAFAYRWSEAPEDPMRTVPKEPIKRNDDLMDADRYMHEEIDINPGVSPNLRTIPIEFAQLVPQTSPEQRQNVFDEAKELAAHWHERPRKPRRRKEPEPGYQGPATIR